MKNQLLLSIIILFLTSATCSAQDSLCKIESRPYMEINDGISVNDSISWGRFNHRFYIPIGFTFKFLGEKFDSVGIETSGRLVFDDNHHFFADAFSEISLQDLGFRYNKKRSLSPISFKHEYIDSSKALIIQFKNAGFSKDSLSVVNFQIRLYEENNEFEIHMGPSKINEYSKSFINGPYSSIYKVSEFKPITFEYRLAIYGDPKKPIIVSDSGKGLNPFAYKLTVVPKEGTVYRFNTTLYK